MTTKLFDSKLLRVAKSLLKETAGVAPSIRIEKFAALIPNTNRYLAEGTRLLAQKLIRDTRLTYPNLDKRPNSAKSKQRRPFKIDTAEDMAATISSLSWEEGESLVLMLSGANDAMRKFKNASLQETYGDRLSEGDFLRIFRTANAAISYQTKKAA